MNRELKKLKLRKCVSSIINSPKNKKEIEYLFSKTNISKEKTIQAYINYDLDINSYGNEIYESLEMRFVLHLHNLLQGSWHQERQNAILNFLQEENPNSVIDMGFGVPTKYVKEYVLKGRRKLVLSDLYDSAFKFSGVLLDYLDDSWKKIISFKKLDMNTHKFPGKSDAYIFQDSLEHVKNPQIYLEKIVKNSSPVSKFILSLPVGPKVPCHEISWDSDRKVLGWLKECKLDVKKSTKVFVNPKVDLFADQLKGDFYNLILLCSKNKKI